MFRGLCSKYRITSRCFEQLVGDGWDDVEQLKDLSPSWRDHILSLAPNGGQKRNLEKMLERVEIGPLDEAVPRKKARSGETRDVGESSQAAGSSSGPACAEGPSSEASGDPAPSQKPSTSPQVTLCSCL